MSLLHRIGPGPLAAIVVVAGCGASHGEVWEHQGAAVIYQDDDRIEARDYHDPRLRSLALDAVGAILPRHALIPVDDGYELRGPTLAERRALCAGEPYADQPSLALCTGTLAGGDTLLTAGHCVQGDLNELVFVRGYALGGEFPRVPVRDVQGVARVLSVKDGDIAKESGDDFAIVKLASNARSANTIEFPVAPVGVTLADPVVVIGTSEGLPMKIEAGGTVFDTAPMDYFEITSDTFEGGSGSPVFSIDGRFLGILVGGAVDYTWNGDEECFRRTRYDAPQQRGEIIVRADVLRDALEAGLADDRTSQAEPTCSSPRGAGRPGWGWLVIFPLALACRARSGAHRFLA